MKEYSAGSINRAAYLDSALTFNPQELALRAYLMDFVPDNVIDVHSHSNLLEHVVAIDERIFHHMMSTFPYFSLEESYDVKQLLFPGKNVQALRFPNAFRGIDHKAANAYLLDESRPEDKVGLYGIPTDVDYTVRMLRDPRVAALKMYPAFFTPPVTEVYGYFKPEILEEAQALGVPIILHPPSLITSCADDLEKVITDFPKLKIVIAHLGLPHLPVPGLREAYEQIAKYDNVCMDTAMIPSEEVVSVAIAAFGVDRIMFGSDEPLNLVRALVYDNPRLGQRLITQEAYHWIDPDEHAKFAYLAKDIMHMHWSAVLALKNAIDRLPEEMRDGARESIFYQNAKEFFGFK
jgi:predicted TIM-barrel fold metal-dependent hydrolase